jgi:hypothetical protein
MAMGSTQPLTEMSTRTLPGAEFGWLACKCQDLTGKKTPVTGRPKGRGRIKGGSSSSGLLMGCGG